MRRIGLLLTAAADDPESLARVGAFLQGLQELGWTDGRNVRLESLWGSADAERIHKSAAKLVALAPDVILVSGNSGIEVSSYVRLNLPSHRRQGRAKDCSTSSPNPVLEWA